MSAGMKQLAARIAKDSITYGGLSILQKAIGFFLLPVYTRLLTPDDYGVLEVGNTAIFFLQIFVLLQIPSAMMRWYLMEVKTEEEKKAVLGTSAWAVLVAAVVVSGIMALGHARATILVFGDAKYESFLWVLIGNTFLVASFQLRTSFFRTLGQARNFAIQNLAYFVLSLGFQILFVVHFRMKAFGALVGALCSLSVMAIWCLPWFLRQLSYPFSWKLGRAMFGFALPMVPGAVAEWVLNSSNRYFIRQYGGLAQVGLFGIASKISMVFTLVANAFILTWVPLRYEVVTQPEGRRLLTRTATYCTVVMTFIAFGVVAFTGTLLRAMTTARYYPAAAIVPWLVFGSLLYCLQYVYGMGITLKGQTVYASVGYGIGAVLNVALNVWWDPMWGSRGAAAAFCASQAGMLLMFFVVSQRLYPLSFEYVRVAKVVAVTGGLLLVRVCMARIGGALGDFIPIGLCLAFPVLLYLTFFFERSEAKAAGVFLRRRFTLRRTPESM